MPFRLTINSKCAPWAAGAAVSLVAFTAAWLLLDTDSNLRALKDPELDRSLSKALVHKSYDWSFELTRFAQPKLSDSDVVVVYLDEGSMRYFHQSLRLPMDRA